MPQLQYLFHGPIKNKNKENMHSLFNYRKSVQTHMKSLNSDSLLNFLLIVATNRKKKSGHIKKNLKVP